MGYTPRHRAEIPSRAPKIAAASAATGAAAALPLMGMAPANAASDDTWDQLAQCESGGDWSINTGNGYFGGLQFDKQTWSSFGGDQYAPTADKASRAQQIEIAEKVQSSQGWNAWPACSSKLDLSGSGGSSGQSEQDQQGQQGQDGQQGQQDQDGQQGQQDENNEQQPKQDDTTPNDGGNGDYTIESGDTLSKIADKEDVDGGWKALYHANEDTIDDPELIFEGDSLQLP